MKLFITYHGAGWADESAYLAAYHTLVESYHLMSAPDTRIFPHDEIAFGKFGDLYFGELQMISKL